MRCCTHFRSVVASTTKQEKQQKEDANDIHVKDQGGEDVFLRTQFVLLPTHNQLNIVGKELKIGKNILSLMLEI